MGEGNLMSLLETYERSNILLHFNYIMHKNDYGKMFIHYVYEGNTFSITKKQRKGF